LVQKAEPKTPPLKRRQGRGTQIRNLDSEWIHGSSMRPWSRDDLGGCPRSRVLAIGFPKIETSLSSQGLSLGLMFEQPRTRVTVNRLLSMKALLRGEGHGFMSGVNSKVPSMPSTVSLQIFLDIVREIGWFTTALFPIHPNQATSISPPGTGTFVSIDGRKYILTARHVWDMLRKVPEVGIVLKEGVSHKYSVPSAALIPLGPVLPKRGKVKRPDLILLRLPSETVGTIEVYKAFYDLRQNRRRTDCRGDLEGWSPLRLGAVQELISKTRKNMELEGRILMGTPSEMGQFSPRHADVKINGMTIDLNARKYRIGKFDYLDCDVDLSSGIRPRNFKGVSGGGLWRYFARISTDMAVIETTKILEGVAFVQSPLEKNSRRITCHGLKSIQVLMKYAAGVKSRPKDC
jgi:hypothetical protein